MKMPEVSLLPREQRRSWRTQVRVLTFIAVYQSLHGYPPTVKEIADGLSVRWVVTVVRALRRLREKGLVTWETGRARTIQIVT